MLLLRFIGLGLLDLGVRAILGYRYGYGDMVRVVGLELLGYGYG